MASYSEPYYDDDGDDQHQPPPPQQQLDVDVEPAGASSMDHAGLNEPEQVLTLAGVVARGWFLFKFQSGKQLAAGFVGALPLSIVFGVMMSMNIATAAADEPSPSSSPSPSPSSAWGSAWMLALLVFDVAYILYLPSVMAAIVHLTAAAHHGEQLSVWGAYKRAWTQYRQLIVAFLGVYVGTALGMLLFIVPGVWFLCKYGLAWTVCTIEHVAINESFRRSDLLLKGRKKVFLLIQVVFVFMMVSVMVASVAFVVWWGAMVSFAEKFFITAIVFQGTSLVLVPYLPMLTAFYYDAVKRQREIQLRNVSIQL